MKRYAAFTTIMFLTLSLFLGSSAWAASRSASGTTSGGTESTNMSATCYYFNKSAAGEDYATADTFAVKAGNIGAAATIYYKTASGSETYKTAYKTAVSTSVETGKAQASANCHGTRAKSSHTYSSSTYGSWSKTINISTSVFGN